MGFINLCIIFPTKNGHNLGVEQPHFHVLSQADRAFVLEALEAEPARREP